jgi:hypothetical protein
MTTRRFILLFFVTSIANASTMHMVLQKTIFRVNAALVDMNFDNKTTESLQALTKQPYSEALENEVVKIIYGAAEAKVTLLFERSASQSRFLSEIESDMKCALKSGEVTQVEYQGIMDKIIQKFSPLKERGLKKGDQLTYQVQGDKVTTTFRAGEEQSIVSQTDVGRVPRQSVLSSYFAKCSEFREKLVRSLFERNASTQ